MKQRVDQQQEQGRKRQLLRAAAVLSAAAVLLFVYSNTGFSVSTQRNQVSQQVSTPRQSNMRDSKLDHIATEARGTGEVLIPKIVHQSWKNDTVPAPYDEWQPSWADQPDWEYMLWTDEDNDRLVKKHYPWFLPTYERLPIKIMKVDAVRAMYLHKMGGVYADLDMYRLRPLEPILAGRQVVLGTLSDDMTFEHNVPNAWMASVPGHPFWLFCLNHITTQLNSGRMGAEAVTGPIMLRDAVRLYRLYTEADDLTLLPPRTIYNDWRRKPPSCRRQSDTYNTTECIRHYKDDTTFYAMSIWTHGWTQQEGHQTLAPLPIEGVGNAQPQDSVEGQQGRKESGGAGNSGIGGWSWLNSVSGR